MLCSSVPYADIRNFSMLLRAHPQAIVADGHSSTTISAEVSDSSGNAAPDGTIVEFTTSLGIIERSAGTAGGVARVRLEGGSTIGTANVTAVITNGNAVARLTVDFLEPGTEMFDESFISVSSDSYLGYDINKKLVDAAGGVKIFHRGITITAQDCQIDAAKNILRAKAKTGGDNIKIVRGQKKLEASALYYDFNSMQGVLISPASDGAKRLKFRGRDMFTQAESESDKPVDFEFQPVSESKMFIQAKSLIIRPGEEIKIKRAKFYMDGDKVLSIPLHVVPLRGTGNGLDRILTYGTDGIKLDVPFYYSLTPNGTGSVRVMHDQGGGWGYYSGNSRWETDLEQEYNIGGSIDGKFAVNRFTSRDWGMRWNQRMEFNNDSQIYTYFDCPDHQNLYSTVDYRRSIGNYTLSMNFDGRNLTSSDRTQKTAAYIQSRPRPLINNWVNYAFTTRMSYGGFSTLGSNGMGTGLGMQFYGKPLQFGNKSSINSSLTVAQDWGGSNSGKTIYSNVGYNRMLGKVGQLGLNYNYSFGSSNLGYSTQSVSADLSLSPSRRWGSHFYLTYGLGDANTSAFGDFNYTILPTWRLHLLGTYQKSGGYAYSDAEFALAKAIGNQEARLIWSQSLKRFRMEFSALSF